MAALVDVNEYLTTLETKVDSEIQRGQAYEGLQYVQSLIARKKKLMSGDTASLLVFKGCEMLAKGNKAGYAGTLLEWFMNGGAGEDKSFHIQEKDGYSDVVRLTDLLKKLPHSDGEEIIAPIYQMIEPKVYNMDKFSDKDKTAVQAMRRAWVDAFEAGKNWFAGFTSSIALGDTVRAVSICDKWAKTGYKTEYPLFFARASLYLFADYGTSRTAIGFVKDSTSFVETKAKEGHSSPLTIACWHAAVMLSDLASTPPNTNLDKAGIFTYISEQYRDKLAEGDPKLVSMLDRIGSKLFGVKPKVDPNAFNPMGMLSSMMGGMGGLGGAKKK
jgi:hypothetical protein